MELSEGAESPGPNSVAKKEETEEAERITVSLPPSWRRWLAAILAGTGLTFAGQLKAIWDGPAKMEEMRAEVKGLSEKMDEVARQLAKLLQRESKAD